MFELEKAQNEMIPIVEEYNRIKNSSTWKYVGKYYGKKLQKDEGNTDS